jgi:glyoxylase-like metal-dependent hydrolase (beta-lactamase superfamily II)
MAFLISGSAGPVLVDAGLPGTERRIWAALRRQGRRPQELRGVVLTHAHLDHCGCLPAVLRASGAPLAAHPLAAARLERGAVRIPPVRKPWGHTMAAFYALFIWRLRMPDLLVDRPLADGDTLDDWGLAGQVLHTPGHSADSITLLLADGWALVGDLLTQQGRQARPQPYFVEDDVALARSVARLRERCPRFVYTSHSGRPLEPVW